MSYDPIHDTYTPTKPVNESQQNQASPTTRSEIRSGPLSISNLVSEDQIDNDNQPNSIDKLEHPSRISPQITRIQNVSSLIDAPTPQLEDQDNDEDYDETDVNSTVMDDDDYIAPNAPHPKKKSATKKKKKNSSITNSKLSLKKQDGEPFWRKDIQYDLLTAIFDDDKPVFTNTFEYSSVEGANNNPKITFAELYIRSLAESNKSSKVLKEKLLKDIELAKAVCKVCVLVNSGRMNTTINFVHDMKSTLRTFHSIPCLQTGPEGGTTKQLQDTPRLKSIIKAVSDADKKFGQLSDLIENSSTVKPNTNVVQLLFLLGNANNGIPFLEDPSIHLLDFFVNTSLSPTSRAQRFLWLIYTYLETNFTEEEMSQNPYGGATIPPAVSITEQEEATFDINPQYEIDYATEMYQARMQYLSEDHTNDTGHRSHKELSKSSASKKREHEDGQGNEKKSDKSQPSKKKSKTATTEQEQLESSTTTLALSTSKDEILNLSSYGFKTNNNPQFPLKDVINISQYKTPKFVPSHPKEEESISFRCDLLEQSNPMVQEVRTSSKASTASFNKKITILGNWIYRYFKYKKSIGNKLAGLEWEDIRYDLMNGYESYFYENLGKSLNLDKLLIKSEDSTEEESNDKKIDESVSSLNENDVLFNYLSMGDYDRINEKHSFLLQMINFANEYFMSKLESNLDDGKNIIPRSNISFDLNNETMKI
ncbi:uncharacterized protein KGF55_001855 [Candida pseudojiufengensis]|uniref:uncharacterized protein n=1 Tax=Candida pseudojiufengensis TaxID=497109 RepID=UPI002224E53F|nr:uncharacterized protein KGF55_001855 [Candida pseudojiufengensis]KAI5964785.1 hypothetical protein KGF55_001855 [Candida pseudojiufengensis]